jgi:large subunit ribosomal protein L24
MKIKTGDKVIIIAGKDKGKEGTVLQTLPKKERVIVEGVNMIKKHMKPSQANPNGGIESTEAPIHISNVMIYDGKAKSRTRVGYELDKDGKKVRIAKKSGSKLD